MKTQTRIDIFVCVQGVKETWVSKSREGGRHCRQFHFYNRLPLLHLLVVILQLHFDFLHPNPHPHSYFVILHFNFTSLTKHPLVSGKESHFKSSYYYFTESWVVPDRHQSPLPYWHLRFSSCWSGDKKGWLQCIFKLLALLENFSQIQLRHALQYMYFTSFANLNSWYSCRPLCRPHLYHHHHHLWHLDIWGPAAALVVTRVTLYFDTSCQCKRGADVFGKILKYVLENM